MQFARRFFDHRATLATSLLRKEPIPAQQINQRKTGEFAAHKNSRRVRPQGVTLGMKRCSISESSPRAFTHL